MAIDDKTKRRIEKLVEVYLAGIQSLNNDAGWTGESVLARAMTYRGDLPPPSGNDRADDAMIRAIQMLRKEHYLLGLAQLFIPSLPPKFRLALLGHGFYSGQRDDMGKKMTDLKIADRIKMEEREYRYYRKRAFALLAPQVELAWAIEKLVQRAA